MELPLPPNTPAAIAPGVAATPAGAVSPQRSAVKRGGRRRRRREDADDALGELGEWIERRVNCSPRRATARSRRASARPEEGGRETLGRLERLLELREFVIAGG